MAGNLGAAPTVRTTAEGTTVANFRIATNEYQGRDANGSAKFHTEWHQIVAWGPLAEAASCRLEKGSAVYVEGVLRTRAFEDKNGDPRRVTEIKAHASSSSTPVRSTTPGRTTTPSLSKTPRHRRRTHTDRTMRGAAPTTGAAPLACA